MGNVADLSNVYRRTLQGCFPPVNRAARPAPSSAQDSLPRLAHLRHNPPAQATLAFDSARGGGFFERTSMEFHGTSG